MRNLLVYLKEVISQLKVFYSESRAQSSAVYRLFKIDSEVQEVILRFKGSRTRVRKKFLDVFNDKEIIGGLPPEQACWFGIYYAEKFMADHNGSAQASFSLSQDFSNYRIIYEGRDKKIAFVDSHTHKQYLEHPIDMVRSMDLIKKFNSNQACYIGLLAGIHRYKYLNLKNSRKILSSSFLREKPKLKVI